MEIRQLMASIDEWIRQILADNYVGVYFHGSLRLGSFNPEQSDLDFIIVAKHKLDHSIKELICNKILEHICLFPKKGCELSVVLEEHCKNIVHPIPYEMHVSGNLEKQNIILSDEDKTDPDLASHFHVINVENREFDFGKPSGEVFSKVPKEYVIDSNYQDILSCVKNIFDDPIYCILNLCRFYAMIKEDLTLSKYDGGKWALENMHSRYHDVIRLAMEGYMGNQNNRYDADELKDFAQESISLINHYLDANKMGIYN